MRLWAAFKDPEFRGLLSLVGVILLSGTYFYHGVEHMRYLDALYFSVTTLTTVGYGDFAPHTDVGKIFTIVYIFVGLGIIFGFVELIAKHAQQAKTPSLTSILKRDTSAEASRYWFTSKRYGYGWTPATWQGWLCVGVYTLALIFIALGVNWASPTQGDIVYWFIPATLLCTALLVWVSYKKGEPARWRWGDDK